MSELCDECKFLDAHGVDVATIGCLACGGGISGAETEDEFQERISGLSWNGDE